MGAVPGNLVCQQGPGALVPEGLVGGFRIQRYYRNWDWGPTVWVRWGLRTWRVVEETGGV